MASWEAEPWSTKRVRIWNIVFTLQAMWRVRMERMKLRLTSPTIDDLIVQQTLVTRKEIEQ